MRYFKLSGYSVGGGVITGFDFLIYEAVEITNKHGRVLIGVQEKIDLGVSVSEEDGGLVATVVKLLIGNIGVSSEFEHSIDFIQCLPEGKEPQYASIIGELTPVTEMDQ